MKKSLSCLELINKLLNDEYGFENKKYLGYMKTLYDRASRWSMCAVGENKKKLEEAGIRFIGNMTYGETKLEKYLDKLGCEFTGEVKCARNLLEDYYGTKNKYSIREAKEDLIKAKKIYLEIKQLANEVTEK